MQKVEESVMESLVCPSFSAYSSNTLDDIADQVIRNDVRFQENDTDFEFVAFRKVADGVFVDNNATPAFPIFDRDLATAAEEDSGEGKRRASGEEDDVAAIQITLGKLLMDDSSPSCSSSVVEDELENVPPGTYCVWTPRKASPAPATPCRKSKSTGSSSSKRWKLLDLLRRSNSEGKESVVFLTPSSVNSAKKKGTKSETGKKSRASSGGGEKRIAAVPAVSRCRRRKLRRRPRETRRTRSRCRFLRNARRRFELPDPRCRRACWRNRR